MNEGQYYHVYTDGLGKSLLYRDEDDYLHGMNDIPICLLKTGAEMLCFCLMSSCAFHIKRYGGRVRYFHRRIQTPLLHAAQEKVF